MIQFKRLKLRQDKGLPDIKEEVKGKSFAKTNLSQLNLTSKAGTLFGTH